MLNTDLKQAKLGDMYVYGILNKIVKKRVGEDTVIKDGTWKEARLETFKNKDWKDSDWFKSLSETEKLIVKQLRDLQDEQKDELALKETCLLKNSDDSTWYEPQVKNGCRSAAIFRIDKNKVEGNAVDRSISFPILNKAELRAALKAAEGCEDVLKIRGTDYKYRSV